MLEQQNLWDVVSGVETRDRGGWRAPVGSNYSWAPGSVEKIECPVVNMSALTLKTPHCDSLLATSSHKF